MDAQHEPPDVWSGSILSIAALLAVTVIAVLVVGSWLTEFLQTSPYTPAPFPLDSQLRGDRPLSPRLEQIERLQGEYVGVHADDLRAERQADLNRYQWIDREKQIVRLPIDRAMSILVETNKLPARVEGRP